MSADYTITAFTIKPKGELIYSIVELGLLDSTNLKLQLKRIVMEEPTLSSHDENVRAELPPGIRTLQEILATVCDQIDQKFLQTDEENT